MKIKYYRSLSIAIVFLLIYPSTVLAFSGDNYNQFASFTIVKNSKQKLLLVSAMGSCS